jgi:hypothetical protein
MPATISALRVIQFVRLAMKVAAQIAPLVALLFSTNLPPINAILTAKPHNTFPSFQALNAQTVTLLVRLVLALLTKNA